MRNLRGIKLVSTQSEVFTSFRGPLFHYPIMRSIDRNNGVIRRWVCFSNGKRPTLPQYLFGKWLWDELNSLENLIFYSLPEVTKEPSIYLSLKSRKTFGVPKKLLRERLIRGEFLGLKGITRQQYLTLKGRVDYFFKEETISTRKTVKYSGYTKHYKDKGSLRKTERDYYISEVVDPFVGVNEEILLEFLTVGTISLSYGRIIFPEED